MPQHYSLLDSMTMRKLFPLLLYLFSAGFGYAQPLENRSPSAVGYLVRKLTGSKEDAGKVRLLLQITDYYVNKPGREPLDMQAALSFGRQAEALAVKLSDQDGQIKANILLSQVFREQGAVRQGMIYAKMALVLSAKVLMPALAAPANFEMSNYYVIDSDTSLQRKIYYYACGLKMLERAKASPLKIADALKFMGDLYQCNRNFEQALSALQRALFMYQRIHYAKLNEVYSLLGKVLIEKGDYSNGIRNHLLAVKVIERLRDTTMNACEVYNNLGVA